MEQIVVEVKDKHKAKILLELLTALDFVNSVKISKEDNQTTTVEQSINFFSFAGLWENRDISVQSIRKKAWPRQYS